MNNEVAVYRVPPDALFSCGELEKFLIVLVKLGTSHIHLPSIASATDPLTISAQWGGEVEFRRLLKAMSAIHPRLRLHLTLPPLVAQKSADNYYFRDVLEKGSQSTHAYLFDLPRRKQSHLLLIDMPILHEPLEQALALDKLVLGILSDVGFFIRYGEHELPLSLISYMEIADKYRSSVVNDGSTAHEKSQLNQLIQSSSKISNETALIQDQKKSELICWFSKSTYRFRLLKQLVAHFPKATIASILFQQHYRLVGQNSATQILNFRLDNHKVIAFLGKKIRALTNTEQSLEALYLSGDVTDCAWKDYFLQSKGHKPILRDSQFLSDGNFAINLIHFFCYLPGIKNLGMLLLESDIPSNVKWAKEQLVLFHRFAKNRCLSPTLINCLKYRELSVDQWSCRVASTQSFEEKNNVYYGALITLHAMVLQCTLPGIPEIEASDDLRKFSFDLNLEPSALLRFWRDGAFQQSVLHRLLVLRRLYPAVFSLGTYMPVKVKGDKRAHVLAFMREYQGISVLVVLPRFFVQENIGKKLTIDFNAWRETFITLPVWTSQKWIDWMSQKPLRVAKGCTQIRVSRLLKPMTFGIFVSQN